MQYHSLDPDDAASIGELGNHYVLGSIGRQSRRPDRHSPAHIASDVDTTAGIVRHPIKSVAPSTPDCKHPRRDTLTRKLYDEAVGAPFDCGREASVDCHGP